MVVKRLSVRFRSVGLQTPLMDAMESQQTEPSWQEFAITQGHLRRKKKTMSRSEKGNEGDQLTRAD